MINRRLFLKQSSYSSLVLALYSGLPYEAIFAKSGTQIVKAIPKSGEKLPVIGMGTWITFNVGELKALREERAEVLKKFFQRGGTMIDSSPMYGSSEEVVGYALSKLNAHKKAFSATKIWTSSGKKGKEQFNDSQKLWAMKVIDLEQIHNLVNWEEHLKYLGHLKKEGKIRYLGITTSHGRRHEDFAKIMKNHDLDFIQLTYNVSNREAEKNLLPLAKERKIAVIANRPYGGGSIVKSLKKKTLPTFAKSMDCKNWPELLLKYIVSHPSITVAIPATTKVEHMDENMGACYGRLLEPKERKKIEQHLASL